jgi:hypothetical protein
MLVRYVRNHDPSDQTETVKVVSGEIIRGGPAVEITERDYQMVSGRCVLEVVSHPLSDSVAPATSETVVTTFPAQSYVPLTQPAMPGTPLIVETPSTPWTGN